MTTAETIARLRDEAETLHRLRWNEPHQRYQPSGPLENALRHAADVLERLEDDALAESVYAATPPGGDPLPAYRTRVRGKEE